MVCYDGTIASPMKTILVPIDFSDVTPGLIAAASSLAEGLKGRLLLLHILTPPIIMTAYRLGPTEISGQIEQEEARVRQILERQALLLRQRGVEVLTEFREGAAVESIIDVAEEQAADFIVIGSHGHGAVYDILVGSTTRGVLREAKQPVLVIPHAARASTAVAGA